MCKYHERSGYLCIGEGECAGGVGATPGPLQEASAPQTCMSPSTPPHAHSPQWPPCPIHYSKDVKKSDYDSDGISISI